MKTLLLFLSTLTCLPAQNREAEMPPRDPVPAAILKEAQAATDALIAQVLKGNNVVAIEKMHPAWKRKEALKVGGIDNLLAEFALAIKKQQADGVKVLMMETGPPKTAYEVDFGNLPDGSQGYKQFMVFVPTRKIVSAFDRGVTPPKAHKLLLEGFMVALRNKTDGDWTFIDGASLRAVDLRELFPFLPRSDEALRLPKNGGRILP